MSTRSGRTQRFPDDGPGSVAVRDSAQPLPSRASHDLLALQRRAGNKAVRAVLARRKSVNVELRTPPPLPKPPPAADLATPENRQLAAEIDALDGLSVAALIKLRTEITLKLPSRGVTNTQNEEHDQRLRKLHAIEYVASRRRREARHYGQSQRERDLAPVQPDWTKWDYVRSDHEKRRAWVRWLVEQRVRETGSFKEALRAIRSSPGGAKGIASELEAIEAEGERFKTDFKSQATANAIRLLDGSQHVIDKLLGGYGLPVGATHAMAKDVFKTSEGVPGHHTSAEAAAKIVVANAREKHASAFVAGRSRRESLGGEVAHLKGLQAKVVAAQKAMWQKAQAGRGEAAKEKSAFVDAKRELAAEWFRAERLHPVLAAYRRGSKRERSSVDDSPFAKIDLAKLDADSVDEQMQAVLVRVLPTLAHIGRARALINDGLTPLKMPAVVALTQSNMFIPEGSIRAGIVNDLVAAQKREDWLITAAALALSLVTLLPTGGASLAMVNIAAGGLAALTALGELERKQLQAVLVDTDLDTARSLSQEEPSLAGFAWALVGLGLEPLMAYHAFRKARELRGLLRRGESPASIVRELDNLGAPRGAPDLGKRALAEAEAAERSAKPPKSGPAADPKPATKPQPTAKPTSAKETAKDERTKVTNTPSGKGGKGGKGEPEKAGKGAAKPTTKRQETDPLPYPPRDPRNGRGIDDFEEPIVYTSEAALRQGVRDALAATTRHGPPPEHVMDALRDYIRSGVAPGNDELFGMVEDLWRLRRDPQQIEDAIAAIWVEAVRRQKPTSETLEALLGGRITKVEDELTRAQIGGDGALLDLYYASDHHGAYTHAFEEFLDNRAKGPGAGRKARKLIANANGPLVHIPGDKPKELYSAVWDALWDVDTGKHFNRPEILGEILQKHLGLPRWKP